MNHNLDMKEQDKEREFRRSPMRRNELYGCLMAFLIAMILFALLML